MKKKVLLIAGIFLIGLTIYFLNLPDIKRLRTYNPEKTSFMKYRENEAEKKGKRYNIRHKWVPLSKVSPYLIKAALIAEDDKFYSHEGFDYSAIKSAIEKDIKAGKLKFGGSTITQQLAKNLFLTPSKNPLRKIREAIITGRLEKTLSKKRILELYLNVAEWGEGIFGIESASEHYYGKPSSELTPEESARLAVALPNPIRYNPLSDSKYIVNRSALILSIMVKRGIIAPEYEEE